MATKTKNIELSVKKWFHKSGGNTYHSVDVYINDKHVAYLPMEYGYGTQFMVTASKYLVENKLLPEEAQNRNLSAYCRENDIYYSENIKDVNREKDL